MGIIETVENRIKGYDGYGIQFSIEPEAYECDENTEVTFGENTTIMQGCHLDNFQPIIINGEPFGFLYETQGGHLFDPMLTSFCISIANCQQDNYEDVFNAYKDNPHFYDEGESLLLRFATLNQFLKYVNENNLLKK